MALIRRSDSGGNSMEKSPTVATEAATTDPSSLLSARNIPEPLAESIRQIIARSQLSPDHELPTAIGVVSALSGEGTTTVSQALAALLNRELGADTCWIDMNWASSGRGSSTNDRPGIYEILKGQRSIEQVLDRSGDAPAIGGGKVPASLRHRLASSTELETLIDGFRAQFQHLVFDLPPVLLGSDGLTALRLVDAHILVVRYGVTTVQQVQAATDQMQGLDSLGVVLNQVRTYTPRPLSRWLAG